MAIPKEAYPIHGGIVLVMGGIIYVFDPITFKIAMCTLQVHVSM